MCKKIIMISGKARNGKNTTAGLIEDILKDRCKKVKQVSFAEPFKNFCRLHLGWDGKKDKEGRQLLITVGSYICREKWTCNVDVQGEIFIDDKGNLIDKRYYKSYSSRTNQDKWHDLMFNKHAKYYGYKDLSLVEIYLKCNDHFDFSETLWADKTRDFILEEYYKYDYILVTDHRFIIEYEVLQHLFRTKVSTLRIVKDDVKQISDLSEKDLDCYTLEYTIGNNGTLVELREKVLKYIENKLV